MTSRPRGRTRSPQRRAEPVKEGWRTWIALAVPVLLVPLLAQRTLSWPFLWDDFDFLSRSLQLGLGDLLPRSDVVFYRPISREIYFWLITRPIGASPIFSHICNALLATSVVLLVFTLARRILNARAGYASGVLMATGAALPMVTGWISGAQDLLCALFFLVACHLQLSGRPFLSALAMAGALLSKETALALIPVPIAIPYLLGRERRETLTTVFVQTCLLAIWALVHPWPRAFWTGAIATTAGSEYVALRVDTALGRAIQGILTAFHLPWHGAGPRWTGQILLPAMVGLVALGIGVRALPLPTAGKVPQGRRLAVVLGGWIVLAATVLTALTIRIWSPYYALIPSIGVSLLAGAFLSRFSGRVIAAALGAFLVMGVLVRETPGDPTTTSELNFHEAAMALQATERGFKELRPSMPQSAAVYVSVQARGHSGLYAQIFRYQPHRIWYDDEGIWVLDPNRRRHASGPDLLFWITPDLAVYEIDLATLEPMGPTSEAPIASYQKTLRGYALGLASAGMVDRAVQIIMAMPQVDAHVRNLDHRFAAMFLYASGRSREAEGIVSTLPDITWDVSVGSTARALYEPVPGMDLDLAAMHAFDVPSDDVPALRAIMLQLEASGSHTAAGRFARRILSLDPTDSASVRVMGIPGRTRPREITAPIPHDIPQ